MLVSGVVLSLALVGSVLVNSQGANGAINGRGAEVTVWLQPTATVAEVTTVQSELGKLSYVSHCVFRSQLTNYHQAKELLSPGEFARLTLAATPASVQCDTNHTQSNGELVQQFRKLPGVYQVTLPVQQAHHRFH